MKKPPQMSLLQQAEARGRTEGRREGGYVASNIREAEADEAYQRGWISAEEDAPRRLTWFALGLIVGLIPFLAASA